MFNNCGNGMGPCNNAGLSKMTFQKLIIRKALSESNKAIIPNPAKMVITDGRMAFFRWTIKSKMIKKARQKAKSPSIKNGV